MCIHIWEASDNGDKREMIRFYNRNPLRDTETGEVNEADFHTQYFNYSSGAWDGVTNPTALCGKPNSWRGFAGNALNEDGTQEDFSHRVHIASQWVFVEDKNDGLGDRPPTRFWWKKSAHVVFRRALNIPTEHSL